MPLTQRTASPGQTLVLNGQTIHTFAAGESVTLLAPGDDVMWVVAGVTPIPTPPPTPVPPVVTPPTTPGDNRPVVSVVSGGLKAAIANAKTPTILLLNGDQKIDGHYNVQTDNLEIRPVGFTAKIEIVAGHKLYNGLCVARQGFRISNVSFFTTSTVNVREDNSATPIAFQSGGGGQVLNCKASKVDQFIKLEQGCHNVQILNCENAPDCLGQGVWGGGDNILIDGGTLYSKLEHPVRFGEDGNSAWRATNVTVQNITLVSTSSKECLSFRKGAGPYFGKNITCKRNTPADPATPGYGVRFGYDSGHGEPSLGTVTLQNVTIDNGVLDVKATAKASKLTFDSVKFTGDAHSPSPLWLNGATNATVTNCTGPTAQLTR